MPNGTREVEVPLPRELHERLVAAAKAEKSKVETLIVEAVKADLRSCRQASPRKKPRHNP